MTRPMSVSKKKDLHPRYSAAATSGVAAKVAVHAAMVGLARLIGSVW